MGKETSFKLALFKENTKFDDYILGAKNIEYLVNEDSIKIVKKDMSGSNDDKSNFFPPEFKVNSRKVFDSRVAIFHKIKKNNTHYWLVTMLGDCRSFINGGKFNPTFGKRIIFNIMSSTVENNGFKSTKTKTFSQSNITIQQKSRATSVLNNYRISSFDESLLEVKCEIKLFGINQTASGGSTLTFKSECDYQGLLDQANELLEIFLQESYKTEYGDLVDSMKPVLDKDLEKELNDSLLSKLFEKNSDGKYLSDESIIFHWPELLNDEDEFKVSNFKAKKLFSLNNDVLKTLVQDAEKNKKIDSFLNREVSSIKGEEKQAGVKIIRCLSAEITLNNETYSLFEGHWYELKTEFVDNIITKYSSLQNYLVNYLDDTTWPEKVREDDFNESIANAKALVNIDKVNIHFANRSKLEIGDLLDIDNKRLFAVKKIVSSAVFSHLKAQTENAIHSILNNGNFINSKFKESKIASDYKGYKIEDTKEFIVAVGVDKTEISGMPKIPFFAKMQMVRLFEQQNAYKIPLRIQVIIVKSNSANDAITILEGSHKNATIKNQISIDEIF